MFLSALALVNYKNFEARSFAFDAKINCFVGPNGVGKTNVLNAVNQLSFGKSYFNPVALQNIKHGEDFLVIDGTYQKNDQEEHVVLGIKKGQKKTIKRNGKPYEKISDHIGFIPLVIISPSDRDLIIEGSETRRKFVDGVIAQGDPEYLRQLLDYQKTLSQRNALLKYFQLNHTFDGETLSIYNTQLDSLGHAIHKKRQIFIQAFLPIFTERYKFISNAKESVNLTYQSQLHEDKLIDLLTDNLGRDRATQYTNFGIHKDDLNFEIGSYPIKKFGSQGQQKSFLIALKLAQFDFLKELSKTTPILLLDDIFDKLDETRVAQIIGLVDQESFGQIFISDTHSERTESVVKSVHQSYKIFNL